MSALSPFVRAFRSLGVALQQQATDLDVNAETEGDRNNAVLLDRLAKAFTFSARNLETQIADDLARVGRKPADDLGPRPAGVSGE
jgi:hypothetical protein